MGKREIARAFGITGGERIGLKRVLREMADEGLIEGKRKRLIRPGDLPSVLVLALPQLNEDGEPIATCVEWNRGRRLAAAHRHHRRGRQWRQEHGSRRRASATASCPPHA
jgi:hypothetical protein